MKSNADLSGFKLFATSLLDGDRAAYRITGADSQRGLFALVIEGKPLYVGKFGDNLVSRLSTLRNPLQKDKARGRIANLIHDSLLSGNKVEVHILSLPEATEQELNNRINTLKNSLNLSWRMR